MMSAVDRLIARPVGQVRADVWHDATVISAEASKYLGHLIWAYFPPAGWHIEVAIRPAPRAGHVWVAFSDPLPPLVRTEWDSTWFVRTVRNDLQSIPGFPDEWGKTREEAVERACTAVAARLLELWKAQ